MRTTLLIMLLLLFCLTACTSSKVSHQSMTKEPTSLPAPRTDSNELAQAIFNRQSVRSFSQDPLGLEKLGDILWSTHGITVDGTSGATRAVPSAGATNPLSIYAVVQRVADLAPGVYRYQNQEHALELIHAGLVQDTLIRAALGQDFVGEAPLVLIVAADFARTTARYGERGIRYVFIEAGHAAQNVSLMAHTLKLGSTVVGAFYDDQLRPLLEDEQEPLLLIPVGKP